jgi:hypothetical protein
MASELKHTVTPAGQGGDFNTLADAIAHLTSTHPGLVAADVYATIEIDGTWSAPDTAIAELSETIIADATRYVHIYTTAAARHNGKWDTGAYMMSRAGGKCIYNNHVEYLIVEGLQLQTTAVNSTADYPFMQTSGTGGVAIVRDCIIRGDPTEDTYAQYGIACAGGTLHVHNCTIYDISTNETAACRCISNSTGTTRAYNTIGVGGYRGIGRTSGTVVTKNCYFGGAASGDYNGTITKTTCASSDATGDTGLQSILVDTGTFVNVSAGTEDFHLAAGSPLIGVGTDTSGDAAPDSVTLDIDGDERGATWDIGSDQYTSGVAAAVNVPRILFEA